MNKKIKKITINRSRIQGSKIYVQNICTRGLYKLYDSTGRIVYIGISKTNVMKRVSDHYREGIKEFDSFMFNDHRELSYYQLEELEIKLIKKHRPKYNQAHNNDDKYYPHKLKR